MSDADYITIPRAVLNLAATLIQTHSTNINRRLHNGQAVSECIEQLSELADTLRELASQKEFKL